MIENQLERTDHNHLGQILTYSAGLDIHTVIWIAKEFREEHRAALDRLNEITNEDFQYFGIEVKVWQIGDSARAPQFEIVSKPNDWNRTVSRNTERAVSGDISERELQNIKFWTGLRNHMIQKGSPLKCRKPSPARNYAFNIGISNSKFEMEAYLIGQKREIGVRLGTWGQDATAHFHLLKEQQTEIEKECGEPLEWDERSGRKSCRISLSKEDTDPGDEIDWP